MDYIQALLSQGKRLKVSWIEFKKDIQNGSIVELLPEKEKWKIETLYSEVTISSTDLQKKIAMNSSFGKSLEDKYSKFLVKNK